MTRHKSCFLVVALGFLIAIYTEAAEDPFDPFGCMSIVCKNRKLASTKNNGSIPDGPLIDGGDGLSEGATVDLHFRNFYEVPTEKLKEDPNMEILYLSHNSISKIKVGDFPRLDRLHTLLMDNNNLREIEDGALDNLTNLHNLYLETNSLTRVPKFRRETIIRTIHLSNNHITRISQAEVRVHTSLEELYLNFNDVMYVHDEVFLSNKKLRILDLSDNPLRRIGEDALLGPNRLQQLYMRATAVESMPSKGIQELKYLDIREIPNLWQIPEPKYFRSLEEIDVTYTSHCCAFQLALTEYELELTAVQSCNNINQGSGDQEAPSESVETSTSTPAPFGGGDFGGGGFGGFGHPAPSTGELKDGDTKTTASPFGGFEGFGGGGFGGFGGDPVDKTSESNNTNPGELQDGLDQLGHFVDHFGSKKTSAPPCSGKKTIDIPPPDLVKCRPKPDSFNPCDNVMGTDILRICSWIIAMFAILGNALLLLVLLSKKQAMTVYKLLMCNLGFANFLMGLYLLLLCCVDAYTYGKYFNYVRSWQYSIGCNVAGFLAIFSTELSLCSLSIITLERYLLIICALKPNMQMKLIHAKMAIVLSWVYSLGLAALPLSKHISSYDKVAICLPFNIQNAWSSGYVVWLLLAYLLSFFHVMFCYGRMYCTIMRSGPSGGGTLSMDFKVAKRMAMIVFSNFACWIPIAAVGFIAMYSILHINVEWAKFLLVFIFPLNACTNPFLYAFFTKVFRGDIVEFLGRCGLCRHNAKRYKEKRAAYGRLRVGSRVSESVSATSSTALMGRSRHIPDLESTCAKEMTIEEHDDDSKYVHVDGSPEEKKILSSDESLIQMANPVEIVVDQPYDSNQERNRSESAVSTDSQELDQLPRMRSVSDALSVLPEVEIAKMSDRENDRESPMTRITTL